MLIAHQAVNDKISSVKASIGNTVTISPAGFSGFSQVNNSLTTTQLSKVATLPNITQVSENLSDRLTTIGSTQPSFGGFSGGQSSGSTTTNTTSLTSPVTINTSGGGGGGSRFFISGGGALPTNFSLPITVLGTNTPTQVSGTSVTISSGNVIDGTKDTSNVLISSNMASKNNLKVGSTFTAYNTSLKVAGIYTTTNRGAENTVILSLQTLQRLSAQSGAVTSATATVNSLDNLSSATSAIKNTLGSSADVVSSVDQANQAVAPLNSVSSISIYSLIGAVVAGGIIILMTMVMIVRERTREIGVLKAIGASNVRIAFQFMSEAVTLTMLGAVVGIVLGALAANPITKLLVTNSSTSTSAAVPGGGAVAVSTGGGGPGGGGFGGGGRFVSGGRGFGLLHSSFSNVHAAVGWSILLYGFGAALLIAVFGSVLASFFISKIRPAEVMRTE
jgi:putative ABC transport system permease protein